MKREELYLALSDIEEEYIEEAAADMQRGRKRVQPWMLRLAAAAACFSLLLFPLGGWKLIGLSGGIELMSETALDPQETEDSIEMGIAPSEREPSGASNPSTNAEKEESAAMDSAEPEAGAPRITLNGKDYYPWEFVILSELPEGYVCAGELTQEQLESADILGETYYVPEDEEEPTHFFVYQECGTPVSDEEVDSSQRQWAYVKWSLH